jgi:hypothetical protein
MARGWLGFLEAMKPVLTQVYGSIAVVENVIAQVRTDYMNPNYHGYNLVYESVGDVLMTATALWGGNLPLCRHTHNLSVTGWYHGTWTLMDRTFVGSGPRRSSGLQIQVCSSLVVF